MNDLSMSDLDQTVGAAGESTPTGKLYTTIARLRVAIRHNDRAESERLGEEAIVLANRLNIAEYWADKLANGEAVPFNTLRMKA